MTEKNGSLSPAITFTCQHTQMWCNTGNQWKTTPPCCSTYIDLPIYVPTSPLTNSLTNQTTTKSEFMMFVKAAVNGPYFEDDSQKCEIFSYT